MCLFDSDKVKSPKETSCTQGNTPLLLFRSRRFPHESPKTPFFSKPNNHRPLLKCGARQGYFWKIFRPKPQEERRNHIILQSDILSNKISLNSKNINYSQSNFRTIAEIRFFKICYHIYFFAGFNRSAPRIFVGKKSNGRNS